MNSAFKLFSRSPVKFIMSFAIAATGIAIFDISGLIVLGEAVSEIFNNSFVSDNNFVTIFGIKIDYFALLAFFLLRFIFIGLLNYRVGQTIFSMAEYFAGGVFSEAVENTKYRQHTSPDEKSATIAVDLNTIINTFLIPLAGLVSEAILVVGIFTFLIYLDPIGAMLFLCCGLLLVLGVQKIIGGISARLGRARLIAEQERIEFVNRSGEFNLLIDVYGLKTWLSRLFLKSNSEIRRVGKKQYFIMGLPKYFYELLFVAVLIGLVMTTKSDLSASYLIVILLMRLMPALNRISTCWASFSSSIAASDRILSVLSQKNTVDRSNPEVYKNELSPENSVTIFGETDVDVCWKIDSSDRDAFPPVNPFGWDLSLRLGPGDIISISGPSGVGKSTLLKSIIGQDSRPSAVMVGDQKSYVETRIWLDRFAYVPQNSVWFRGSVLDNILVGRPYVKDDINTAILNSQLFEMGGSSRELSLDTKLGPDSPLLSGGQLQRLSLARALYGNPIIILLDEFTSSLDEKTESEIIETIRKISANVGIVGVSHRPTFNKICTRAIVFEKGMPRWA